MSRDVSVMTRSVMLKMANSAGHLFGGTLMAGWMNFRHNSTSLCLDKGDNGCCKGHEFLCAYSLWPCP